MIHGETVILITQEQTGTDPFGSPIYTPVEKAVDDVLLGSPSFDQAIAELNLYGKRIAYTLGIPKGNTDDWMDKTVLIRGRKFRTYGFPLTQTPGNVPGRWNTQVKVESYVEG